MGKRKYGGRTENSADNAVQQAKKRAKEISCENGRNLSGEDGNGGLNGLEED